MKNYLFKMRKNKIIQYDYHRQNLQHKSAKAECNRSNKYYRHTKKLSLILDIIHPC